MAPKSNKTNNYKNVNLENFIDNAAEQLKTGKPLSSSDGILAPLIKKIIEKALETELDEHLGYAKNGKSVDGNYRNGSTAKTIRTSYGDIEIDSVRDRDGTYEPKTIKKRQSILNEEISNKIISLFGLGLSYIDIHTHLQELYTIDISPSTITEITNRILPEIKEWQNRPLDRIYPFIFMDAIFYKVREDGRVVNKAVYVVLGITQEGKKEILGIYFNESEGAKFWLSVLTDLSNRGVKDILIACIDNLKGFSESIESIFPNTEIQLCIIHQIRNSLKYVSYKDQKLLLKDLKRVYKANSKSEADQELESFCEKWDIKYPIVTKSWKSNWDNLSNYFKYTKKIRKVIYTTNIIESVNRQFRKTTKTKGAFPNEDSLRKILYLTIQNITKRWTQPFQNWPLIVSQLSIIFKDRLELELGF